LGYDNDDDGSGDSAASRIASCDDHSDDSTDMDNAEVWCGSRGDNNGDNTMSSLRKNKKEEEETPRQRRRRKKQRCVERERACLVALQTKYRHVDFTKPVVVTWHDSGSGGLDEFRGFWDLDRHQPLDPNRLRKLLLLKARKKRKEGWAAELERSQEQQRQQHQQQHSQQQHQQQQGQKDVEACYFHKNVAKSATKSVTKSVMKWGLSGDVYAGPWIKGQPTNGIVAWHARYMYRLA
jgi:hypothetical protein